MESLKTFILLKKHGLKILRLKEFRKDACNHFEVWKKNDKYYVAVNAIFVNGDKYAQETIPCENDLEKAKKICDEYRREYILKRAKETRSLKKVY